MIEDNLASDLNAEMEKDFPNVKQPLKHEHPPHLVPLEEWEKGIRDSAEDRRVPPKPAPTSSYRPPTKLEQALASIKRSEALLAQVRQLTDAIEASNKEAEKLVQVIKAVL